MTEGVDSRERVQERIRAGTGKSATKAEQAAGAHAAWPRDYVRRGTMTVKDCHERFIERLREYDAEVVECRPEELAARIAAQLGASGRRRFVAPAGLPEEWLMPGFEWKIDHDLEADEVEQCEGVVTACFCGVAESGTIVLHHSASEGRRVITLLPDWHLCVVRASQIVETLPEYFDRAAIKIQGLGTRDLGTKDLEDSGQILPRLVTWISGPSATADIEMTRIKGVHGPRFLNVILVKDRD